MMVALWCGALGIVHAGLALPLGIPFMLCGLFLLGVSAGIFNVTVTGTLQLRAGDDMRGRVMAMYPIGILGSGLVGAPVAGMLADRMGVQGTFLLIAVVCMTTAGLAAWAARRA